MLIVKKFGGSSVADKDRIFNVAERCIEDYKKGHDIIVVLSAMGKDDRPSHRPGTGDQPSGAQAGNGYAAGHRRAGVCGPDGHGHELSGVPAVSLNAFQVQMHHHPPTAIPGLKRIDCDRIRHELDNRRIVIITGFQGINKYDDFTTLGRGGSDTTAVALAAALHADACEIYTDVEGVYTADPRIVPNARKMKEISYDEMLELASLGAKVLHNRSVELAKKYGVQLVVRSSLNRAPGTVVKEGTHMERMLVSGVAVDKNTARISVIGLKDEPGIAFKLFNLLAKNKINVDMIPAVRWP